MPFFQRFQPESKPKLSVAVSSGRNSQHDENALRFMASANEAALRSLRLSGDAAQTLVHEGAVTHLVNSRLLKPDASPWLPPPVAPGPSRTVAASATATDDDDDDLAIATAMSLSQCDGDSAPIGIQRWSGETDTEEANVQAAIQRSMAEQTHRRQPAAEARNLTGPLIRFDGTCIHPQC